MNQPVKWIKRIIALSVVLVICYGISLIAAIAVINTSVIRLQKTNEKIIVLESTTPTLYWNSQKIQLEDEKKSYEGLIKEAEDWLSKARKLWTKIPP